MFHIVLQSKQLSYTRRYVYDVMFMLVCAMMILASCTSSPAKPLPPLLPTVPAVGGTNVEPASLSTKSPLVEDWPSRWLKGIPCRPPCWEGITPGRTTAAEAVEILKSNPLIATAERSTTTLFPELGYVEWNWVSGDKGGEANYNAHTPTQTIYIIYPYFPWSPFRLSDVIEAYGEPSHVIGTASHSRTNLGEIEYILRIMYRPQGFMLLDYSVVKPVLNADLSLRRIVFFAPTDEGFAAALAGASEHPDRLVPWQGFKDFDFYCRGEACSEIGK